jgi:hypothetical protein
LKCAGMRTQQCPNCRARYNVARLERGIEFECRRCKATVVVGQVVTRLPGVGWGLLLAAVAMAGAAVLLANPAFGPASRKWPWELALGDGPPLARATWILWGAAAAWAFLTAWIPALRARSALTLALGGFLVLLAASDPTSAFRLDPGRSPVWVLGVVAVAAGATLVRREAVRAAGRALALLGALALFWEVALGLARSGAPARSLFEGRPWHEWAPLAAVLAAAACSLLLALGVRARGLAIGAFLLLAAGLLMPAIVGIVLEARAEADFRAALRVADEILPLALRRTLFGDGVLLAFLGLCATSDLVRARATPRTETPA